MPDDKPQGLLTNTPVITGRTVEVQSKDKEGYVPSPMLSPNLRKDQIKTQALQTLRGIAGGAPVGNLSKFGPISPDKKPGNGNAAKDPVEESKATGPNPKAKNILNKLRD